MKIKNWPVTQPACLPPPLGILDICRSNGARWQRKWRHIYIDFRFGFHKSRLALSPPHLAHKLTTLGACASDKLTTVDACASVKVGGEMAGRSCVAMRGEESAAISTSHRGRDPDRYLGSQSNHSAWITLDVNTITPPARISRV